MPNDCCATCCIDGEDCGCVTVKQLQQPGLIRQIAASSLASLIATLSLNPITVIKVRLQSISTIKANAGSSVSIGSGPLAVSTLGSVVRDVLTKHGVAGFWAGVRTGIVMSVPNTVLYMSVYEYLKDRLANEERLGPARSISPAIAGALARMNSVTIISPLELVRTIQTGGVNDSISGIARSIIARDGIKGLYKGWAPSVLRDCPFSAIYWLGFEKLRPVYSRVLLPPSTSEGAFPAYITFLSGATAGMVAAAVTHPFDVLKTRQQVAGWEGRTTAIGVSGSVGATTATTATTVAAPAAAAARKARLTLVGIYQSEGVLALYKGLSMRLATVIPASAIMVTIYETIKRWDL